MIPPEDWTSWLTEKEREWNADLNDEIAYSRTEDQGGLNRPNDRLIQLQGALCTVAALRALVAEKDKALRVAVIVVRYGVQCGCGDVDYCRTCEAKLIVPPALALTESDMLKRMEEK